MAVRASLFTAWLAAAGLCLTACSWSQSRPDSPSVDGSTPAEAPQAAGEAEASKPAEVGDLATDDSLEVAENLLIRIHDVEGLTTAQAGALLAPATDTVEECEPAEPGTLNVRVVGEQDRTTMEVAPGSNVDSETRRCVLAALAVVDDSEGLDEITSPTDRPRQFSSNLSISW
ncbi:MAG: hypothetical protein JRI23_30120 [Deltaproteobacteria bacterium]|jgi:hypothetical protein|nr:hypothetical protein [Deltaproteobacteria bacterium]MBW2536412.1 hypothetical protein [Deltaproteobacteria bacterium]